MWIYKCIDQIYLCGVYILVCITFDNKCPVPCKCSWFWLVCSELPPFFTFYYQNIFYFILCFCIMILFRFTVIGWCTMRLFSWLQWYIKMIFSFLEDQSFSIILSCSEVVDFDFNCRYPKGFIPVHKLVNRMKSK